MTISTILASVVVVTNIGFTAAFDTERHLPVWAEYDLRPNMVVKTPRVSISFRGDPRIPESDTSGFYKGSGLDRGHLVPAADMNWNTNALRETYYFSNVVPQVPSVNRGTWRDTEDRVRELARSGSVHVVVIPVYTNSVPSQAIIPPSSFIKVAYGTFGAETWVIQNE